MGFSKAISAIYRKSNIHYDRELRKLGLKSGMMMYIMCLCDNPGISQEEMAKDLMIDKSTVAKAIKQLVEEGYVLRSQSEVDNREYILQPSAKALKVYEQLNRTQEAWFQTLTAGMTEVERTLFLSLLDKIRVE